MSNEREIESLRGLFEGYSNQAHEAVQDIRRALLPIVEQAETREGVDALHQVSTMLHAGAEDVERLAICRTQGVPLTDENRDATFDQYPDSRVAVDAWLYPEGYSKYLEGLSAQGAGLKGGQAVSRPWPLGSGSPESTCGTCS